MNFDQSNTSTNDIPIAESTKIEKTAKTPLKRLRLTLASRLGLHSNPNSPSGTPQSKKNSSSTNSPTLSKLDPQVYLDTQSNGFASRVVKYHDANVAKNRNIANKIYRRPGDLPIVNLDKSELNLNQKQANAPTVSKINIAPPINLVNASNASARSTIFRTGKNYGESYPIGKLGPIEGRKPIKATHTLAEDEPIVPTNNDYDSAPVQSSLDALKEISRKRIHCDEIDGETNKKQRADSDFESNNAHVVNTSKRTRDRTSPSFCSSATEVQKKRYKNNDILSSLSSSILMSTPKRSALNVEVAGAKIRRPEFNYDRLDVNDSVIGESCAINKNIPDSGRIVGMSKSDLPLHHPTEQIKPVIKSMSDGYEPQPSTTKTNKLTLFNKVYAAPSSNEKRKSIDDDDVNSISFVKPKAKASSIFSVNRDKKSKLAMMLSFLRGDESKDEVDSIGKPSINAEKTNEKEEPKVGLTASSTSANLNTSTAVTFSTATTTSLLNVPSDVTKPTVSEPQKTDVKSSVEIVKPTVTSAAPLISFSTTASTAPSTTVATATSQNDSPKPTMTFNSPAVNKPTVTFSLPTTTTTAATPTTTTAATSASGSSPRLGGFSFPATSTPLVVKPATTESPSIAKTEENKPAPPSFSFGLTKSTANSTTLPSFTAPTFGSNTLAPKTESTTASTPSTVISTATATPPTFNFGSPAASKSTVPVFGSTNVASTASSTLNQTSSSSTPFAFGSSTTSVSKPELNTSITSASTTAFVFGTNTNANTPPTTSVPVFGSNNTIASTATTNASSTQSPAFAFGAAANATKPQTGAFQFGKTTTTNVASPPAFGSPSVSTPLFGATTTANATPSTTSSNQQQSDAFTFGANKPITDSKPLFGTNPTNLNTPTGGFAAFSTPKFGETNANTVATPVFGSAVNTTMAPATNLFGSAQNTPVFGSSNISSTTQPKTENVFGAASNQAINTPVFGSQNQSNTFGKPSNTTAFGSNNNLFGSAQSTTQNLFSTPTTTANLNQTTNSAFGAAATPAPSGVFAFGQSATPTPAAPVTTASTNIFGSNTNTNPSSPFVFGQSNSLQSPTPSQPSGGMFGNKPIENSLTAPPAFGSSATPAFNFNAKPTFGNPTETKPSAFSFNAPNNNAAAPSGVPAFGSPSATPQFGAATNGIGSSFAFGATNNQPDASKPFNFGGPSTAPAAPTAPFTFNAPNPGIAPTQSAFQFNAAPQQPTTNMFSIGPGSTTKTGRPMRTATRRMK